MRLEGRTSNQELLELATRINSLAEETTRNMNTSCQRFVAAFRASGVAYTIQWIFVMANSSVNIYIYCCASKTAVKQILATCKQWTTWISAKLCPSPRTTPQEQTEIEMSRRQVQ